ncbi:hypothetical protein OIO90_004237 [Microbotryomycetes sp. JL221]|nr:hypothetical protein OIO90_004237 [Microbotryomycetes sp. JL221]
MADLSGFSGVESPDAAAIQNFLERIDDVRARLLNDDDGSNADDDLNALRQLIDTVKGQLVSLTLGQPRAPLDVVAPTLIHVISSNIINKNLHKLFANGANERSTTVVQLMYTFVAIVLTHKLLPEYRDKMDGDKQQHTILNGDKNLVSNIMQHMIFTVTAHLEDLQETLGSDDPYRALIASILFRPLLDLVFRKTLQNSTQTPSAEVLRDTPLLALDLVIELISKHATNKDILRPILTPAVLGALIFESYDAHISEAIVELAFRLTPSHHQRAASTTERQSDPRELWITNLFPAQRFGDNADQYQALFRRMTGSNYFELAQDLLLLVPHTHMKKCQWFPIHDMTFNGRLIISHCSENIPDLIWFGAVSLSATVQQDDDEEDITHEERLVVMLNTIQSIEVRNEPSGSQGLLVIDIRLAVPPIVERDPLEDEPVDEQGHLLRVRTTNLGQSLDTLHRTLEHRGATYPRLLPQMTRTSTFLGLSTRQVDREPVLNPSSTSKTSKLFSPTHRILKKDVAMRGLEKQIGLPLDNGIESSQLAIEQDRKSSQSGPFDASRARQQAQFVAAPGNQVNGHEVRQQAQTSAATPQQAQGDIAVALDKSQAGILYPDGVEQTQSLGDGLSNIIHKSKRSQLEDIAEDEIDELSQEQVGFRIEGSSTGKQQQIGQEVQMELQKEANQPPEEPGEANVDEAHVNSARPKSFDATRARPEPEDQDHTQLTYVGDSQTQPILVEPAAASFQNVVLDLELQVEGVDRSAQRFVKPVDVFGPQIEPLHNQKMVAQPVMQEQGDDSEHLDDRRDVTTENRPNELDDQAVLMNSTPPAQKLRAVDQLQTPPRRRSPGSNRSSIVVPETQAEAHATLVSPSRQRSDEIVDSSDGERPLSLPQKSTSGKLRTATRNRSNTQHDRRRQLRPSRLQNSSQQSETQSLTDPPTPDTQGTSLKRQKSEHDSFILQSSSSPKLDAIRTVPLPTAKDDEGKKATIKRSRRGGTDSNAALESAGDRRRMTSPSKSARRQTRASAAAAAAAAETEAAEQTAAQPEPEAPQEAGVQDVALVDKFSTRVDGDESLAANAEDVTPIRNDSQTSFILHRRKPTPPRKTYGKPKPIRKTHQIVRRKKKSHDLRAQATSKEAKAMNEPGTDSEDDGARRRKRAKNDSPYRELTHNHSIQVDVERVIRTPPPRMSAPSIQKQVSSALSDPLRLAATTRGRSLEPEELAIPSPLGEETIFTDADQQAEVAAVLTTGLQKARTSSDLRALGSERAIVVQVPSTTEAAVGREKSTERGPQADTRMTLEDISMATRDAEPQLTAVGQADAGSPLTPLPSSPVEIVVNLRSGDEGMAALDAVAAGLLDEHVGLVVEQSEYIKNSTIQGDGEDSGYYGADPDVTPENHLQTGSDRRREDEAAAQAQTADTEMVNTQRRRRVIVVSPIKLQTNSKRPALLSGRARHDEESRTVQPRALIYKSQAEHRNPRGQVWEGSHQPSSRVSPKAVPVELVKMSRETARSPRVEHEEEQDDFVDTRQQLYLLVEFIIARAKAERQQQAQAFDESQKRITNVGLKLTSQINAHSHVIATRAKAASKAMESNRLNARFVLELSKQTNHDVHRLLKTML